MSEQDKIHSRTLSTYKDTLSVKSKSTQKLFECTLNNLNKFGGLDVNNMINYDEDSIYAVLQKWVIWNFNRGITSSTIMCYFNSIRSYLWYHKIKLDWRDIRQNIRFPRTLYGEQIPITKDAIRKILSVSDLEFRFQLLALISSGMRVGELGQIRSMHIDLTHSNIMVKIPATITKTGRGRITFFSKQVSNMIRYRIKHTKHDFLFCGNRTAIQSTNLILKRFSRARQKANLLDMYDHCKQNRYKLNVHSLRSYFITKANNVQFGLGHMLAGHEFYMRQYNRYTADEFLQMYKNIEKNLTF